MGLTSALGRPKQADLIEFEDSVHSVFQDSQSYSETLS